MNRFCDDPHCDNPGQTTVEFGRVNAFLQAGGFILLAENKEDPNCSAPLEAWAYCGALDLDTAAPITFGLGANLTDAIGALDHHLTGQHVPPGPSLKCRPAMLLANDRELATILAALRFHQAENLQGTGEILDQAIREIATDTGKLTPLDFHEVEDLCEKLNCGESQGQAGLPPNPPLVQQVTLERATAGGRHNPNRKDDSHVN